MPITSVHKDAEALTMTVVADFAAPLERLWDAYADPRQLESFWGPPSYPATFTRHDMFPGGRSAYAMVGPEGDVSRGYWEFLDVKAPHSFEVRDGFCHADGTPNTAMPSMRMTFEFEATGSGSRLTTTTFFTTVGELRQLVDMGMEEGMREAMGQIDAVLADLPVAAVKTGMLGSADAVALVAARCGDLGVPLVVDPVLVATSGAVLGDDQVARAYRTRLLPVATVVTPNLDEAELLVGMDGPPELLARLLAETGPAVVLTGGACSGSCTEWVAVPGEEPLPLAHDAVATSNDHGTGCTFSAALAVHLARRVPLIAAVRRAATYTTAKLRLSQHWELGRGRGPIAHTRGEIA